MATRTDIDIVSRALVMIGEQAISSFSQGSTPANIADAIYEDLVQERLTSFPWRFAMKKDTLNRLVTAPLNQYDAAYQIPADCLAIQTVRINDSVIEYTTFEDEVYCNASINDTVTMDYIYRVTEENWPPYFVVAVELYLAAFFATALAEKPDLGRIYDERANFAIQRAQTRDSQTTGTTKKMTLGRFNRVRFGSGGKFTNTTVTY